MTDRPGPPRFRPRGSFAPSAASWLDRASGGLGWTSQSAPPPRRPGFVSLQSFPFAWVAHPSSGSLAPLPFVLAASRCGVLGRVTRGFTRLGRRSGVGPRRILHELGAPFQHVLRRASRSPWTSHAGLTTSRPLRRLRSVPPHRESVHVALDGHPVARAVGALLGVPRPSRALLPP